jgi:hypothetical protein
MRPEKPCVGSSIPPGATTIKPFICKYKGLYLCGIPPLTNFPRILLMCIYNEIVFILIN